MASRNGRVPANEAKVSANGADAKTEIAVQTPQIKALPRANGRIKAEASEELNGVSESHSTLETNDQVESGDEESVSSDATEAVRRLRGQVGPPRIEWPVEAERASDRQKFKQSVAVELLTSGKGVTAVARELHVVPSTIYRWLQDPVFLGELETRRDEIIEGPARPPASGGACGSCEVDGTHGVVQRAGIPTGRDCSAKGGSAGLPTHRRAQAGGANRR